MAGAFSLVLGLLCCLPGPLEQVSNPVFTLIPPRYLLAHFSCHPPLLAAHGVDLSHREKCGIANAKSADVAHG